MEELIKILDKTLNNVNYEKETKLLTDGKIDSVELVKIIVALEEKFQIEILLDEIIPENFDSIYEMWNMVQRISEETKRDRDK